MSAVHANGWLFVILIGFLAMLVTVAAFEIRRGGRR